MASVQLQCSSSAAAVLRPRCKQLAIGCAPHSGVLLVLTVSQPPLSKQVSDGIAV